MFRVVSDYQVLYMPSLFMVSPLVVSAWWRPAEEASA